MKTVPDIIALFIPCLVDSHYPPVAEAMVAMLRRLGVAMAYPPEQTCCGQPAYNAGFIKEAAAAARHFIAVFEQPDTVARRHGVRLAVKGKSMLSEELQLNPALVRAGVEAARWLLP